MRRLRFWACGLAIQAETFSGFMSAYRKLLPASFVNRTNPAKPLTLTRHVSSERVPCTAATWAEEC